MKRTDANASIQIHIETVPATAFRDITILPYVPEPVMHSAFLEHIDTKVMSYAENNFDDTPIKVQGETVFDNQQALLYKRKVDGDVI